MGSLVLSRSSALVVLTWLANTRWSAWAATTVNGFVSAPACVAKLLVPTERMKLLPTKSMYSFGNVILPLVTLAVAWKSNVLASNVLGSGTEGGSVGAARR